MKKISKILNRNISETAINAIFPYIKVFDLILLTYLVLFIGALITDNSHSIDTLIIAFLIVFIGVVIVLRCISLKQEIKETD
ncbi:hypothetical protein [Paenibacillus agilis]|uniref:Uncharacterized protein n=1 Tax=Paenibacillus agilis TaxID=3020863 RepID=A0A559ID57_9BACL|nr:hypothetical protein [Paenibacillus agilis]TVX85574.1 hypothetical protein FPZ44_24780 [Paenibacillus agilis]